MIPKEIAFQLVQLKEKVKTYSSIQRSLDVSERRDEVDEIKEVVENVNIEIADLTKQVNNILVDGSISKFEIEDWFEDLKDKSDFPEPNPREIYEEEQRELERQRKVAEEKARQERDEYLKLLKTNRIEEYQNLCYYGPDDFDKVQQLIKDGFDIKQDGKIYDLSMLINLGRSLKFIEFLIEAGMKVNEDEQQVLERQIKIAEEKVKQKLVEIERQKQIEEENTKKQLEESKRKLKAKGIEEFLNLCNYGPDDIEKVQKLIIDGLDFTQSNVCPSIPKLLARGRSMKFIKYLVAEGMKITGPDILYCIKSKSDFNSVEFLNVLITAKNIDQEAAEMAKAALRQKAEDQKNILEQENKLAKLKAVTHGKFDSFYNLLKEGDLDDIKQVFKYGFLLANQRIHMNNSEVTYSILSIFESRSIEFVQLLVDAGYCVTKKDIDYYYENIFRFPNYKQIVDVLIASKNIDSEAIERVNEIKRENERVCLERIKLEEERKTREEEKYKKEEEEHQKKLQTQRIEEFKKMCQYGQTEDLNKLQKLIKEGLDINNINDFDCLGTCIISRKSKVFISFLVDSGILVTSKHINYCLANFNNKPPAHYLIKIFKNAKNIDNDAVANILKKERAKRNQIIIGVIVVVVIIALFYVFFEEIMGVFKILFIILLIPLLLPIILKKR